MRKINGNTAVQQFRKQVFNVDLRDFDTDEYLEKLGFL